MVDSSLCLDDDFNYSEAIYLDHAGATLASKTQLRDVFDFISENPLANPHSKGPLGERCAQEIDKCRERILEHFGANPDEYSVIFTSGSTASMKLVGESFPWSSRSKFCYPYNAHTSLLGLREYSENVYCIPSSQLHQNSTTSTRIPLHQSEDSWYSLLALPGECNFSGSRVRPADIQHLLDSVSESWLQKSNALCVKKSSRSASCSDIGTMENWLWLLDASKLASTSDINISRDFPHTHRPHFFCVSFYKIFGYPTGIGALLVKKSIGHLLHKKYWGGGAVLGVSADSRWVVPSESLTARLEDGTLNFQAIASLQFGFAALHRVGGMVSIQEHTFQLSQYLFREMNDLRHSVLSRQALCIFYGRHEEGDPDVQGPVITFNLRWANGALVGFGEVERVAVEHKIQLRTGCFCCIGGCQEALGLTGNDLMENSKRGRSCADTSADIIDGRPTGAVRVSLGYMSSRRDCDALLRMLREMFLDKCGSTLLPVGRPVAASIAQDSVGKSVANSTSQHSIQLRSIYVYPIKSCAGIRVDRWPLSSSGLFLDREWAVVRRMTGDAITQKSEPKLALCVPSIHFFQSYEHGQEGEETDISEFQSSGYVLRINAPGMSTLEVVFLPDESDGDSRSNKDAAEASSDSNLSVTSVSKSVRVCIACHDGVSCSKTADEWFSAYLGTSCVFVKAQTAGAISSRLKSNHDSAVPTSFSNEAQFLILSLHSVQNLQNKVKSEVPNFSFDVLMHIVLSLMHQLLDSGGSGLTKVDEALERSFRPNFVVYGDHMAAHDEDAWTELELKALCLSPRQPLASAQIADGEGENVSRCSTKTCEESVEDTHGGALKSVQFRVTGPCARCSMVNVHPSKGNRDPATLRMLASYRKDGSNIFFGQYLAYDEKIQSELNVQFDSRSGRKVLVVAEGDTIQAKYCV